jgi:hypothetical protein
MLYSKEESMTSGSRLKTAGFEFLTIVAGVLVALAADGWRERLAERRLEVEYIGRVISDLTADLDRLQQAADGFERKREPLRELMEVNLPTVDEAAVVRALRIAGWGSGRDLQPARATTFDEMRSTGRISLIQDAGIRDEIAAYYAADEGMLGRIDSRRAEFGPLSYSLYRVPWGDAEFDWHLVGEIDGELIQALHRAAVAEWNRAAFAESQIVGQRNRTEGLIEKLREYQTAL